MHADEQALIDNRRRQQGQPLHESWFVKANNPNSPQALWLKMTLCDRGQGSVVGSAWCSIFDGVAQQAWAGREQLPLWQCRYDPGALELEGCRMLLDAEDGEFHGTLSNSRGHAQWEIQWRRVKGPLGDPLCLPPRRLIDGALLKSQLLSPAPAIEISGQVTFNGERWNIDKWLGMQGHNWSQGAAVQYVWGHSLFIDDNNSVIALVEALSGRVKIAGLSSPDLALMLVRHEQQEYRFDRIAALWRRQSEALFPAWTLKMRSDQATATLNMRAQAKRMVCLGYEYPGKPDLAYCLNSKLAEVELRVEPKDSAAFVLRSRHLGALEFLQRDRPDGLLTVL